MHRSRFIRIQIVPFWFLNYCSPMIDRNQRLLFSVRRPNLDPTCCNRFWPCLSDRISPPPLSNRPRFACGYRRGRADNCEGPTTTISEKLYPLQYRRGSRSWIELFLRADSEKQIANILVVSPFSLSLPRNFYNRHSSRNIFMRFSFFLFFTRRGSRPYIGGNWKNLNVIVVVLPRCGNCLR